jgi:hypothetical protein
MSKLFPKVQTPSNPTWCGNVTANGTVRDEGEKHLLWPNGVFPLGRFGTQSVGDKCAEGAPPAGNRTGERTDGF